MTVAFKPELSDLPPVCITYHVKEREWELMQRWAIYDPVKHAIIDVPQGFRFDLASIPRPLWRVIAPFELSIAAPLCHDFLYRRGGKAIWQWESRGFPDEVVYTRKEADDLFLQLMEREGVSNVRRRAAWAAVRVAGRHAWKG